MQRLLFTKQSPGICFLIEDFYPIIHGASTQIIKNGVKLIERGARVSVITRKISPDHLSFENLDGIEVYRVPPPIGLHRIGKYLMMVPSLIELVRHRKDIDSIIVCDLKVLGILGVFAAKILGKSCILNAVSCGEIDGSFATQFGQSSSWWRMLLVRYLTSFRNKFLSFADGFVGVSGSITKEFLHAGFPKQAVFEIHNGIEMDKVLTVDEGERNRLRTHLGFPEKRCFVYTGRLVKGKGLEYLLRVWSNLVKEFTDIHLILIGSGQGYSLSCEEELQEFIQVNQLALSVSITGAIYNVYDYLAMANFFVFPSETEGCPMSLLEALAFGLPSIATEIDGITDIVQNGQNGILVPYGDEASLFAAMKDMLNNPEKAERLGNAGRHIISDKFSLDVIVDRYVHLINSVTHRRPVVGDGANVL